MDRGKQPTRGGLPGQGRGNPIRGGASGHANRPLPPQAQQSLPTFQNLQPRNPARAGAAPGGKPGGVHQENASQGTGKIYSYPGSRTPPPSVDVTKKENNDVLLNPQVPDSVLQDRNLEIPLRTGFGTTGTNVLLYTNYFHLVADPSITLWKYSVAFKPRSAAKSAKDPGPRQRRRLLTLLLKHTALQVHGHAIATDYNESIITRAKMTDDQKSVTMKYWDAEEHAPGPRSPEYDVTITFAQTVEMAHLKSYLESEPTSQAANYPKNEALTALNAIVAKTPTATAGLFVFGGNRYYSYPVGQSLYACLDLGGGLIAVRGYYASVRTSTLRTLVNVHTQTSAFFPPVSVYKLMTLHGFGDLTGLGYFLQKLRVKTSYMKAEDGKTTVEKVKTIMSLSNLNARSQTFLTDQGMQISVETYFLQTYRIRLLHPEAPLLLVGIITTDKNGKPLPNKKGHKSIWLPAELATVMPGQMYTRKLSSGQTKAMLNYAARPPAENARRLVDEGLQILGFTPNNPTLKAFGLEVKREMVSTNAKVIPPPLLQYQGKTQATFAGSWNMQGLKFAKPSTLFSSTVKRSPWGVMGICCNASGDDVKAFQEALTACGLGNHHPQLNITLPLTVPADSTANDQKLNHNFTIAKGKGIKVILIILPTDSANLYSRIKFWSDCKVGIHTVCCQASTFAKRNSMTYANEALKFNAKLGGTNHYVRDDGLGFLGKDTMIVGIDVTHAEQNSMKGTPSIAGVVASVDEHYSQWPGSIRLQAQMETFAKNGMMKYKTREIVEDLAEMMKERLEIYKEVNKGSLPKKILVYRDGVSESQYDKVLESEYQSIVRACKESYAGWPQNKPPITIFVVGKRHHTRFYPAQEADSDLAYKGKRWPQGNCKPGTTVDRAITMNQGFDFYQQAHACLQGTAKPAHNVIIKDELKRSADEYQRVTHALCYLFARATKAVSICPPAYYADLLCERGRCYLHKYFNAEGEMDRETWDWNRSPWVQSSSPHPDLAGSMFYL